MNFASRLKQIEEATSASSGECPTCRSPAPAIIDRTEENGGPEANPLPTGPCPTCGRRLSIIQIIDEATSEAT